MKRIVLLTALLGCVPVASAQNSPLPPAASASRSLSQPQIDGLLAGNPKDAIAAMAPVFRTDKSDAYLDHALAAAYMRAGLFQQARQPMDAAFAATKTPSRAMVLNRAMLDVALRTTAPRAVKDMTAYLTANTQADELAVDVLGTAIARAVANSRQFTSSPIFSDGVRVYEARNADLEAAAGKDTPGMKHWGTRWLTAEQYADLEARRQRAADERQAKLNEFQAAQADAQDAEMAARQQQVDNEYLREQLRQSAVITEQQRQIYVQQQQAAAAAATGPGATTRPVAAAAVAVVPATVNLPGVVQTNLVFDPSTGRYVDSRFPIPPGTYEASLAAEQNRLEANGRLARARAALGNTGPALPQPRWITHFDPVWPPDDAR